MSHHLSGPNLRPPLDDPRLDLTDVFVFQAPADPTRTVLIMDVNSFAFVPGATPRLHPDAVYRLAVDTDGDDRADVAFNFTFSTPGADGAQTVTVHRATGDRASGWDATGEVVIQDAPVSFAPEPDIVISGDLTFAAGLRSDPFFADLEGIGKDFAWTGRDTMADKNVMSLALEMSADVLGSGPIGVWGRVCLHRDGRLESVDRGAHPSLTAYFNTEDAKDAYNRADPADDRATYMGPWIKVLEHTGGYTPLDAARALETVLPDILRFDRTRPAAYPNGRALHDDVTDARLYMLGNGKIADDGIGPHTDLLDRFPYLGPPHPQHP